MKLKTFEQFSYNVKRKTNKQGFKCFENHHEVTWEKLFEIKNKSLITNFLNSFTEYEWELIGLKWLPKNEYNEHPQLQIDPQYSTWAIQFIYWGPKPDQETHFMQFDSDRKPIYKKEIVVNPRNPVDFEMIRDQYQRMLNFIKIKSQSQDFDQFGFFDE